MISPAAVRNSSPTITRHSEPIRQLHGTGDGVVVGDADDVEPTRRRSPRRTPRASSSNHRSTSCGCADRRGRRPAGAHRREVRMPSDRCRRGNPHGPTDQLPDIVTSRMTRLIPDDRIGSHSTSPPISTMSSSMRCSVEAIVISRTGRADLTVRDQQAGGAGREVAADGVDAGVQALHLLHEQPVVDVGDQLGLAARVPGGSDSARQPTPGVPANPPRVALPVDTVAARRAEYELWTNLRSVPFSIRTLRRAARPSPSTSVAV